MSEKLLFRVWNPET